MRVGPATCVMSYFINDTILLDGGGGGDGVMLARPCRAAAACDRSVPGHQSAHPAGSLASAPVHYCSLRATGTVTADIH